MAIAAKDIPVQRSDVEGWIQSWNSNHQGKTLEDYIRWQINKMNLEDDMVITTGHDNLPDEMHIADMVMMDLPSYLPADADATSS